MFFFNSVQKIIKHTLCLINSAVKRKKVYCQSQRSLHNHAVISTGSPSEPEYQATGVSGAFGGKRCGWLSASYGGSDTGESETRMTVQRKVFIACLVRGDYWLKFLADRKPCFPERSKCLCTQMTLSCFTNKCSDSVAGAGWKWCMSA